MGDDRLTVIEQKLAATVEDFEETVFMLRREYTKEGGSAAMFDLVLTLN